MPASSRIHPGTSTLRSADVVPGANPDMVSVPAYWSSTLSATCQLPMSSRLCSASAGSPSRRMVNSSPSEWRGNSRFT